MGHGFHGYVSHNQRVSPHQDFTMSTNQLGELVPSEAVAHAAVGSGPFFGGEAVAQAEQPIFCLDDG